MYSVRTRADALCRHHHRYRSVPFLLRRLAQKKLGFRTLFDVIPLDPGLVRGSHGLPATDPLDRPLLIGDGQVNPI